MSLPKRCILAACLLFGVTVRLHAELFTVVEITDLRGNAKFQVCTEEEKKKIETEVRVEAMAYPKALEETKVEWVTAHKEAFPGGRLKPRALKVVSSTTKREEADKELVKSEEHVERTIASDKAEKERVLNAKPVHSRRGGGNQAAIEQQKHKITEDREKDALADKAEALLRKKLSAAVGHEVSFYGETPSEQKKDAAPNKKKKT